MGLPGVKLMHKCINTQMPNEIYKQLIFPKRFHQAAHIRIANSPRTVQSRRSLIYKATHQFNQLLLNLKLFKIAIKKCKLVEVTEDQMTNSKQNTSPKLLIKHISPAN